MSWLLTLLACTTGDPKTGEPDTSGETAETETDEADLSFLEGNGLRAFCDLF
ncbi:MAG: hypothetical protein ACI8S6_002943 [Myxococcota bacterium]|jgi:hypothetical protein